MNFVLCKINTSRVSRYARAHSFLAAVYNWYSLSLSLSLSHFPLSRTRPTAPPTSLTSLWRCVNIHVASVTWVRKTIAVISIYGWSISKGVKRGGREFDRTAAECSYEVFIVYSLFTSIILPLNGREEEVGDFIDIISLWNMIVYLVVNIWRISVFIQIVSD